MSSPWTMRRSMVWVLVVVNVLFLGVILYLLPRTVLRVRVSPKAVTLPVLSEPVSFSLVRETGQTFTSETLKNNAYIADFIFTRCPNQCPTMSFRFASLQKTLPKNVKLVSFSVDPQYDSPDKLQKYAERFQADSNRWVFLTGSFETIHKIQSDLKLVGTDTPEPGLHSLRFVLLDGEGRARGYYDSEDNASLAGLSKDVNRLETK